MVDKVRLFIRHDRSPASGQAAALESQMRSDQPLPTREDHPRWSLGWGTGQRQVHLHRRRQLLSSIRFVYSGLDGSCLPSLCHPIRPPIPIVALLPFVLACFKLGAGTTQR